MRCICKHGSKAESLLPPYNPAVTGSENKMYNNQITLHNKIKNPFPQVVHL